MGGHRTKPPSKRRRPENFDLVADNLQLAEDDVARATPLFHGPPEANTVSSLLGRPQWFRFAGGEPPAWTPTRSARGPSLLTHGHERQLWTCVQSRLSIEFSLVI